MNRYLSVGGAVAAVAALAACWWLGGSIERLHESECAECGRTVHTPSGVPTECPGCGELV